VDSKTFIVPNISCRHCTRSIENEVGEMEGVIGVKAEVETKRVTIEWQAPANWDKILSLLEEINYSPEA